MATVVLVEMSHKSNAQNAEALTPYRAAVLATINPLALGLHRTPTVSRPSLETLESLRITLQKLDSMQDATAMAELKRSILLRIAELEAANTLQRDEVVLRTDDAA